jgi:hypothetical protein
LTRLGQIMRGCANYFKHAVAKSTLSKLDAFTWWRLVHMLRARHRWSWGQLRRQLATPARRWLIAADGIDYYRIEGVIASRYALPGQQDPNPLATPAHLRHADPARRPGQRTTAPDAPFDTAAPVAGKRRWDLAERRP